MKKNILKTSLVAWSLLAFGFAVMSSVNPANIAKADPTPTTWTAAQVEITVEKWLVTIWLSGTADTESGLNLTPGSWIKVSNDPQVLTWSFWPDSFWISDQAGTISGYRTTLSVTNLSWVAHPENAIPASNVKLIASGGVNTITWSANAGVLVDQFTDWTVASSAVTFFHRDDGNTTYAGILWEYGSNLGVEVTVPAHTIADTYVGTITYTLYDLDTEVVAP